MRPRDDGGLRLVRELLVLPRATVGMWGGPSCREAFHRFTARHPRLPLVRRKVWGVALLRLPPARAAYLAGAHRQTLRAKRNRALRRGFTFRPFEPRGHAAEILAINVSLTRRQGRPMDPAYREPAAVDAYVRSRPLLYGVFDGAGRLRAYADAPACGEVFNFARLLAHGDDLAQGIAYLLASEVIVAMIARQRLRGCPRWAMYDTFLGASPGLRFFKRRLGFAPYRVRWRWLAGGKPQCGCCT